METLGISDYQQRSQPNIKEHGVTLPIVLEKDDQGDRKDGESTSK